MSKTKTIQYPFAADEFGNTVEANDAIRGKEYACIGCGQIMHLRKGEIYQAHFAHASDNRNCSPESMLHKLAKNIIKNGIEASVRNQTVYPLRWLCNECGLPHTGDLAITPRTVLEEYQLSNGIRSDLLVMSEKNKPLTAIEVVVTHDLEEATTVKYKNLGIPVIIIEPEWEHLSGLSRQIVADRVINFPCRPEKTCSKCKSAVEKVDIELWRGYQCWKCAWYIDIINVISQRKDGNIDYYTPGLVKIANSMGAPLHLKGNYPTYICPRCSESQGTSRVITVFYEGRILNRKSFWFCNSCEHWLAHTR